MIISSAKNEFVKSLKKQIFDKEVICLDNPKMIKEANEFGVDFLYVLKKENYALLNNFKCETITLSESVFNIFATTQNSQGLLAIVKIKAHSLKPPQNNFLVLDTIQDPGNVGTLIRSALGANFLDVYLLDSAKISNEKVVRSSMGTIFKVRCYEISKEEFVKQFKTWNKKLFMCDMNGTNIYNMNFENGIGIVVGNEGQGVSNLVQKICTNKISIPMQNNLESLNAGVSGSLVMFQIANQK